MPARLLWLTQRYPPARGGMATSCARQTALLRRADICLDVVAVRRATGALTLRTEARDRGSDFFLTHDHHPGLVAQRLWRLVRQEHAQAPFSRCVGFGAGQPGYWAVTLAAWLGVESSVLVRGNDFDRDWFDPRQGWMVQESLARAGTVGAVTPDMAERIAALLPAATVQWVPNSVDPDCGELLPAETLQRDAIRQALAQGSRRIIGIFGELKYKKRLPLLLGALRDSGMIEQAALLIVGRLEEDAQAILADPGLAPHHQVHPFLAAAKLAPFYAACDFVAVPSLFDGMPNVLLEGMAAGAVPLASDAGACPAVIRPGEDGFLFPAEDREACSEMLRQALGLPGPELAAMAARARERVRTEFSSGREESALRQLLGLETRDAPV